MKIHLPDFKPGVPRPVHESYDPKHLDLEFVDLKYTKPLDMEGTVEKGHDTVTFRGNLTSEVVHICGRCLIQVSEKIDEPFELFYETKDIEDIETLADLREVMLLGHAITYVCRSECRGLCPNCGINLNEAACKCESRFKSEPFSALKNIRITSKEGKRNA